MARKQASNVVVGLDIGTSKIAAVIGKIKSDGEIEIIGMGTHPSRGLKKGVVVNIDSTVESIQRAIDEAERMSGYTVESVYVGIAGSHIQSFNSNGMVAIRNKDVQYDDIERVMDAAQTMAIPGDQRVLHILAQEYIIDNQGGVREPIGMSGVRLEARVHMVTGSVSAAQNIAKCVERCGLEVEDIILEQLASSESVLSEDEKELGVCLVDIGGGTTDIAVFHSGAIRHTAVISVAGDQVTNDIAVALRTPTQAANEIKLKYACALPQLINRDEEIEVPSVGDRPARCLSRRTLVEVIEPRYEELFQLIQNELRSSGFEDVLAAGVVMTGGSSLVEGAVELAEEVFHMPVRLGYPDGVSGLSEEVNSPAYATTVGLLMYAKEHSDLPTEPARNRLSDTASMFERMKNWFKNSF
ncbi:cell division protein FtsA [Thiomicrorhabdus sp.]|uniref:cell division protein FtsA n=1 Tax=Thiomicrorhabdus sp. TaxID=2039724 RepID=UPI0029C8E77F|nr:cell division protein FtsA [Thiomicrorhabdus sp.]